MNNNFLTNLQNAISEKKVVLKNGLTVMVCEMPDFSGVYAMYGTNYGSVDRKFTLNNKQYDLPAGTAHFLEHKMFENEEGVDAFSLYAKTGASANAYTSFDKTCYLFSATNDIEKSLDILLSFVSKPYFTKKTIQKEQGIIGQEIKMYDDSPEWRMMFALLENLYHNCPVKEDIAGTVDSIATITPELLYACTNAFYRPANMVLSVAGNITLQQVLNACERADIPACTEPVTRIQCDEPCEIVTKESSFEMSVSQPVLGLAFKEIPFTDENRLKGEIICDIISELLVGDTSALYRKLYDEGLVNSGFSCEYLAGPGYLTILFSGETKDPAAVKNALYKEIERIKQEGVDEKTFKCIKNGMFGDVIADLEKTEAVSTSMLEAHMMGYTRFEAAKALAELTVQDVDKALKIMLRPNYSTVVCINPKK